MRGGLIGGEIRHCVIMIIALYRDCLQYDHLFLQEMTTKLKMMRNIKLWLCNLYSNFKKYYNSCRCGYWKR